MYFVSIQDQLGKEKDKEVERRAMSANYGRVKTELAPDDENRELQEAYQFLLKKFELNNDETQEKQALISPFMQMTMDADEDWKLAKQRVENKVGSGRPNQERDADKSLNESNGAANININVVRPKTAEPKGTSEEIDKEEENELKEANKAAAKLATVTMNGLLAEPDQPKRQKSLKRKSVRRKENSAKAARK